MKTTTKPSKLSIHQNGKIVYDEIFKISIKDLSCFIQTKKDAEFICREMIKKGFLKKYTLTDDVQSEKFADFLKQFWD